MKRTRLPVITALALLFCIRGQSQSITPSILNVAGGNYYDPAQYTQFEWSFGELTLIDTYTSTPNNLVLTNGLLQPCTDMATKSPDILVFADNEYKIFPNVTTGKFELDFFLNVPGQMELQLTDALGRVISKRSFEYHCCDRIERYDISYLPDAVYFINARFTPLRDNIYHDYQHIRRESTFRVVKAGK